jgi:DNA-binding NarL/FixJ family response regulator
MTKATEPGSRTQPNLLGLVWIDSPYPLATIGFARVLEGEMRVHVGREPPEETPSIVIFGVGGGEGLTEGLERLRGQCPGALILVFGPYLDLALARDALRAGARGYLHAGMPPEQIVRAIKVATEGQLVAPRQLLEYLLSSDVATELNVLSARQREILTLVGEGLSNAQIARKLFLTESTIKQHLRAVYKVLGVKNRTEAASYLHNGEQTTQ